MGIFSNNKPCDADQVVSGGGITATYEEAMRFINRKMNEEFGGKLKEAANLGTGMEVVIQMIITSSIFGSMVSTVAFAYGKTEGEVMEDFTALRECGRKGNHE